MFAMEEIGEMAIHPAAKSLSDNARISTMVCTGYCVSPQWVPPTYQIWHSILMDKMTLNYTLTKLVTDRLAGVGAICLSFWL